MLRKYQKNTIELCRKAYKNGKRKILVVLPTGAGKTVIFTDQIKTSLKKNKRVLVVVRRRSIVMQTKGRISQDTGERTGVFMGVKTTNITAPVVVSSIDTIGSRIKKHNVRAWLESFNTIIVDEAHDATSDTYLRMFDVLAKSKSKDVILGYTATPYHIGNKGHVFWDACVMPIKPAELRDEGYLAPITIYSPASIDTKKVAITGGDYNGKQLYECVNTRKIYGKIVDTYKKLASGRSALVFCVNKEHSRKVCEEFKENGFNAEHCDCGTDLTERARVLRFMKQSVKDQKPFILCNVNIFSTGIDIPEVGVCIQARPTASKVLYIQQVGRVLRPHPSKDKALLIDHGGNALRFGSPYDDHNPDLMHKVKWTRKDDQLATGWRCSSCAYFSSKSHSECPSCGHKPELIVPKESVEDLIMLHEESVKKYKKELYFIRQALLNKGKSHDLAYFALHKKHGSKIIEFLVDLNCPHWLRTQIIDHDRLTKRVYETKRSNFGEVSIYK